MFYDFNLNTYLKKLKGGFFVCFSKVLIITFTSKYLQYIMSNSL